jgi:hypothetical protein
VMIPIMQFSPFETQELLNLFVAVFALVLFAISLTAYQRSSLRRLLFVSSAFGLFAVKVLIQQLAFFMFQTEQIISTVLDFVILLLFFLALVVNR